MPDWLIGILTVLGLSVLEAIPIIILLYFFNKMLYFFNKKD